MLVDNALSPRIAFDLTALGYDTLHVRDIGLATATDLVILQRARSDARVIISADVDFGELLATSGALSPSVVLWRARERRPAEQSRSLAQILAEHRSALAVGAIVVVETDRVRVRVLPIVR